MGRDLQKKKRRSSRQPVRITQRKKVLNPLGNDLIAKNWCVHACSPANSHLRIRFEAFE